MTAWDVFTRDQRATRSGPVPLLDGKTVIRFNGVGTWTLEALWENTVWDRVDRGTGMILRRGGRRLLNGPVTNFGYDTTYDESSNRLVTTIHVEGVSDEIVLADRVVYPDPARAGNAQTTQTHWSMTGPAETVLRALVDQQLGPSARPERRVPNLTLAPDQGRGPTVSAKIRYGAPNLLAEMQIIANKAGLGFQIVPDAGSTGLLFEIVEPRDKSAEIRFGVAMNNVGEQHYRVGAPTLTYALDLGKGEGTARLAREFTTTDPDYLAWGRRIETVIDSRDTDDTAEMLKRATDAVVEDSKPEVSYSFEPLETDTTRYGKTWDIGDRVTVFPGPPGRPKLGTFVDLVREIRLDTDGDTDRVRAAVGTEEATTGAPLPTTKQLLKINRDLRALQRSA